MIIQNPSPDDLIGAIGPRIIRFEPSAIAAKSLHPKIIDIRTTRLHIDEITPDDAPAFADMAQRIAGSPNLRQYYWFNGCQSRQDFVRRANELCANAIDGRSEHPRPMARLAIRLEQPLPHIHPTLIGSLALDLLPPDKGDDLVDIGYMIDPLHHGHGYATEAAWAGLKVVVFDTLHWDKAVATVHPENTPSIKVLQHLGGECTERRHNVGKYHHEPRDVYVMRRNRFPHNLALHDVRFMVTRKHLEFEQRS